MTGQFTMHIMASFIIGLMIAFPYVCWEVWRFVKPGLQVKERKYSRGAVAAVSVLFFLGSRLDIYVIAPWMVYFLANYSISDMVVNEFDITSYVSTVVMLVFGSGLAISIACSDIFFDQNGNRYSGIFEKIPEAFDYYNFNRGSNCYAARSLEPNAHHNSAVYAF